MYVDVRSIWTGRRSPGMGARDEAGNKICQPCIALQTLLASTRLEWSPLTTVQHASQILRRRRCARCAADACPSLASFGSAAFRWRILWACALSSAIFLGELAPNPRLSCPRGAPASRRQACTARRGWAHSRERTKLPGRRRGRLELPRTDPRDAWYWRIAAVRCEPLVQVCLAPCLLLPLSRWCPDEPFYSASRTGEHWRGDALQAC